MSSWANVALRDVADVFNGKTPSKAEQRNEGHPVLKIRDVSELGKFRGKHESFVDSSLAAKYSAKQVRDGDTLILNAAHNADYVGSKTYRAEPPVFGTLATGEWLIIRPSKEKLDASFVHHWVTSKSTRSAIRNVVNGIHLYPKDVARLDIALPPLPEQRRIATILDQADALRAKRREALAQLDSLTQSIFNEMFGDPATNTATLNFQPLESLLEESFQNGAYFPKETYCESAGTEMVHMSDAFGGCVKRGNLKRVNCSNADIKKYTLTTSDILIARRSLTYEGAAKPCMIPQASEPLIFESSFIRVRPDRTKITPLYLFHYLNNDRVKKTHIRPYVTQSTISGINQSNLAQVPVLQPPLELQQKFGVRVQSIEHMRLTQVSSLSEFNILFASLQHRAFRGEL